MTDEVRIEAFAIRSGLVAQSLDALRPSFPRWVGRLQALGVTNIPTSALSSDAQAVNLLSQFIRQAAPAAYRDHAVEHNLRNLTGIRPPKP
jgi:hypothetical protein